MSNTNDLHTQDVSFIKDTLGMHLWRLTEIRNRCFDLDILFFLNDMISDLEYKIELLEDIGPYQYLD